MKERAVIQEIGTRTNSSLSHDLLTTREVAKLLRVDESTVRRWIHKKALEAVELPGVGCRHVYRIKRETLEGILTPSMRAGYGVAKATA